MNEQELRRRLAQLEAELAKTETARGRLLAEARSLRAALAEGNKEPDAPSAARPVTSQSGTTEKLALFRSLFRGRQDVWARRWESTRNSRSGYSPACANEWQPGMCDKRRNRCGRCPHREFLPLERHHVLFAHLAGEFVVGVYPLLHDDTCRFLGG